MTSLFRNTTAAFVLGSAAALPVFASPLAIPGAAPQFIKISLPAHLVLTVNRITHVPIKIQVLAPYHIQGHPAAEGYIPTTLYIKKTADVKLVKMVYPHPVTITFYGQKLPVYEKQFTVLLWLKPLKPGSFTLPLSIHFQGCNASQCYPPSTISGKLKLQARKAPERK